MVIKDDSKRTFEVCGQASSDNAFTNKVYGMQRAGMNISYVILPVTNRTSSKELISIQGYKKEDGLWERCQQEHRANVRKDVGEWNEE